MGILKLAKHSLINPTLKLLHYFYVVFVLMKLPSLINTLMLFWFILDQRKSSLVVFLWRRRTSSVVFLSNIRPLVIILAKKTTKLVFTWPNMSQKIKKVLIQRLQPFFNTRNVLGGKINYILTLNCTYLVKITNVHNKEKKLPKKKLKKIKFISTY